LGEMGKKRKRDDDADETVQDDQRDAETHTKDGEDSDEDSFEGLSDEDGGVALKGSEDTDSEDAHGETPGKGT